MITARTKIIENDSDTLNTMKIEIKKEIDSVIFRCARLDQGQ